MKPQIIFKDNASYVLSEKQSILLDQIRCATEQGVELTVMCGKYKTSFNVLGALIRKGLVKTDKKIGLGFSTFKCTAL